MSEYKEAAKYIAQIEALQAKVTALESQIEEARNQTPVFWRVADCAYKAKAEAHCNVRNPDLAPEPLYAAPVPPVMRELSDEEILSLWEYSYAKHLPVAETDAMTLCEKIKSCELDLSRAIIKAAREG